MTVYFFTMKPRPHHRQGRRVSIDVAFDLDASPVLLQLPVAAGEQIGLPVVALEHPHASLESRKDTLPESFIRPLLQHRAGDEEADQRVANSQGMARNVNGSHASAGA